jgi:hypothetical protein
MTKEQTRSASFFVLPSTTILESPQDTLCNTQLQLPSDNADRELNLSRHFVGHYKPSNGLTLTDSQVQQSPTEVLW